MFNSLPLPLTVPGTVFGADGSETLFNSAGSPNLTKSMPTDQTVVTRSGQVITAGGQVITAGSSGVATLAIPTIAVTDASSAQTSS